MLPRNAEGFFGVLGGFFGIARIQLALRRLKLLCNAPERVFVGMEQHTQVIVYFAADKAVGAFSYIVVIFERIGKHKHKQNKGHKDHDNQLRK